MSLFEEVQDPADDDLDEDLGVAVGDDLDSKIDEIPLDDALDSEVSPPDMGLDDEEE